MFLLGALFGLVLGASGAWLLARRAYRRGRQSRTWYVRKPTPPTPPDPLPGQQWPTIEDAFFTRTNLPGSTSKME